MQEEAVLDITLASKSQTLLARGQIRVHAAECDRPAVHIEPGDFGIRRGVDLQLVHLKSPQGHAADLRSSVPAEDDFPGVWAHLILQIRLRAVDRDFRLVHEDCSRGGRHIGVDKDRFGAVYEKDAIHDCRPVGPGKFDFARSSVLTEDGRPIRPHDVVPTR